MKEEKERERVECEKKQKEMMMEQIKLSKSIAEQIRRYQMTVRKSLFYRLFWPKIYPIA